MGTGIDPTIVVEFEEIKVQKVRKSSRYNKVRNSSKKFKIHIQSQLLSKYTQYCQHCNNVKLHAVQCTSARFLTNAHFNNKGYTSIHCVSKKDTMHPTTNDNFNNSCPIPVIFGKILLSKYAVEKWFNVPPHLFIVRTLPWEL